MKTNLIELMHVGLRIVLVHGLGEKEKSQRGETKIKEGIEVRNG